MSRTLMPLVGPRQSPRNSPWTSQSQPARLAPSHQQGRIMSDVMTKDLAPAVADAAPELIEDLVMANRILFQQGVVDGFGHVSARHDKHPDRFLISRSMAPALVNASDIMAFDFDGNPLGGDTRNGYLERFLHGAIFRARPDVNGIVHSHSPAVIPFGLVKEVPLRAVSHMGGFLKTGVPIYEIRDSAG